MPNDVTILVPALDLGAIGNAENQSAAHDATRVAVDNLRTGLNRALLRGMRTASGSAALRVLTTDPIGPAEDDAWLFRDGGAPENLSLRVRRGGVTYDVPLFTFP